ncbi:hypothetical protein B296_00033901 [Ensete ventricosum]|uniref:Uncharacterized protein n=1 Tax=Ensete ventricosum TaxID=4639 RepID=A0A426YH03_ENSVE|nr:hypothetical protein B296_00033901 [Ensete ventricosum]
MHLPPVLRNPTPTLLPAAEIHRDGRRRSCRRAARPPSAALVRPLHAAAAVDVSCPHAKSPEADAAADIPPSHLVLFGGRRAAALLQRSRGRTRRSPTRDSGERPRRIFWATAGTVLSFDSTHSLPFLGKSFFRIVCSLFGNSC